MTKFILTEHHLELARKSGAAHARAMLELELDPDEHYTELDEEDVKDLTWRVTSTKISPDSDESFLIVSAYEEAFWEEVDNDKS